MSFNGRHSKEEDQPGESYGRYYSPLSHSGTISPFVGRWPSAGHFTAVPHKGVLHKNIEVFNFAERSA